MLKKYALEYETGIKIDDVDNMLHDLVLGWSTTSDDKLCIVPTKLKAGLFEGVRDDWPLKVLSFSRI